MRARVILGLLAVLAGTLAGRAVEVDGVAARVNAKAILKSDVIEELKRTRAGAAGWSAALEDLVARELILKSAKDAKMTIQEWVIDNRVRDIINRSFGGDRNRLMEMLVRQQLSYPKWRQRIHDDVVVQAMRWQMVDKNVTASPEAMGREYAQRPERYRSGGGVTVSVILLKPEDAARRDEIAARLARETFADVARSCSADSHAADGGVWKDINPPDVFRREVCDALARLEVGQSSDWIDQDGWSFLLRKDAETPCVQRTFAEAYEDIARNVRNDMSKRLFDEWIARLKSANYVKIY